MASNFRGALLLIVGFGLTWLITVTVAPPISAFFGLGEDGEMYLMFFIFFAVLGAFGWGYDKFEEWQIFKDLDDS